MYIDEKLIKILEPHRGETIDVSYAISLIKTIAKEHKTEQCDIPIVGWRSELLPEFDVQEINEILQYCKEKKEDLQALICRIWNKGYMTAVCDEREG